MEGEDPVVSLLDEMGRERRFRMHDAFDLDGSAYYLVEATDDPDLVLLLKESAGGLETVDGDEFDQVLKRLEEEEANDGVHADGTPGMGGQPGAGGG
jgi:hypothetical protein